MQKKKKCVKVLASGPIAERIEANSMQICITFDTQLKTLSIARLVPSSCLKNNANPNANRYWLSGWFVPLKEQSNIKLENVQRKMLFLSFSYELLSRGQRKILSPHEASNLLRSTTEPQRLYGESGHNQIQRWHASRLKASFESGDQDRW